eukprot:g4842.t1
MKDISSKKKRRIRTLPIRKADSPSDTSTSSDDELLQLERASPVLANEHRVDGRWSPLLLNPDTAGKKGFENGIFPSWLTSPSRSKDEESPARIFQEFVSLTKSELDEKNKSYGPDASSGLLSRMFRARDFELPEREAEREAARLASLKSPVVKQKHLPILENRSRKKGGKNQLPGGLKMWKKISVGARSFAASHNSPQYRQRQRQKLVTAWVTEKYDALVRERELKAKKLESLRIEKEEKEKTRRARFHGKKRNDDSTSIMRSQRKEREARKNRELQEKREQAELLKLRASLESKAQTMIKKISDADLHLLLQLNTAAERANASRQERREKKEDEGSALSIIEAKKERERQEEEEKRIQEERRKKRAEAAKIAAAKEEEDKQEALRKREEEEKANPTLKLVREYEEFQQRKKDKERMQLKSIEEEKKVEERLELERKKQEELKSRGVNLESSSSSDDEDLTLNEDKGPQYFENGGRRTFSMTLLDRTKWLMQIPMFQGMPCETVEKAAEMFYEETYEPNESICVQDAEGNKFYALVKGDVRVLGRMKTGTWVTYAPSLKPGFVFGEVALVFSQPRTAEVVANANGAVVLSLDRKGFSTVLSEFPRAASILLEKVLEHTTENAESTKDASKREQRERRLAKEKAKRAEVALAKRQQTNAANAAENRKESLELLVNTSKEMGLKAFHSARNHFYLSTTNDEELKREDGSRRSNVCDVHSRPHSKYRQEISTWIARDSNNSVTKSFPIGRPRPHFLLDPPATCEEQERLRKDPGMYAEAALLHSRDAAKRQHLLSILSRVAEANEKKKKEKEKVEKKRRIAAKKELKEKQQKLAATRAAASKLLKLRGKARKIALAKAAAEKAAEAAAVTKKAVESRRKRAEHVVEKRNEKDESSQTKEGKKEKFVKEIEPSDIYGHACDLQRLHPRASLILQNVGRLSRSINLASMSHLKGQVLNVMRSIRAQSKERYFRTFQFRDCKLSDSVSAKVLDLIPLTGMEIGLAGNFIGQQSLQTLRVLGTRPHQQIQELDLRHTNLRDTGAIQLASCFRREKVSKAMKKKGVKGEWSMPHLLRLNIADNQISDIGAKSLLHVLQQRGKAWMTHQKREVEDWWFAPNSPLQELCLAWNMIRKETARAMKLPALEWLDLSWNPIGGGQYETSNSDANIKSTKEKTDETSINLKKFAIALRTNKSLTHLNLSFCQLTVDDAVVIGKALSRNRTLLGIHMEGILLSPLAVKQSVVDVQPPQTEAEAKEEENVEDESVTEEGKNDAEAAIPSKPFGVKRWERSTLALPNHREVTIEVVDIRDTKPGGGNLHVVTLPNVERSVSSMSDVFTVDAAGFLRRGRFEPARFKGRESILQFEEIIKSKEISFSKHQRMEEDWLGLVDGRARVSTTRWREDPDCACCWICGGWQETRIELSDDAVVRLRKARKIQQRSCATNTEEKPPFDLNLNGSGENESVEEESSEEDSDAMTTEEDDSSSSESKLTEEEGDKSSSSEEDSGGESDNHDNNDNDNAHEEEIDTIEFDDIDFDEEKDVTVDDDYVKGTSSVRIHLHCDGYKGRELALDYGPRTRFRKSQTELVWSLCCVLPPGRQHFFFSIDGVYLLSRRYNRESLSWVKDTIQEDSIVEAALYDDAQKNASNISSRPTTRHSNKYLTQLQTLSMNFIDVMPRQGPLVARHFKPREPRRKKKKKKKNILVSSPSQNFEEAKDVGVILKENVAAAMAGTLVWSTKRKNCDSGSLWDMGRYLESVDIEKRHHFLDLASPSSSVAKVKRNSEAKKERHEHVVLVQAFKLDWLECDVEKTIANLVQKRISDAHSNTKSRLHALEDEHYKEIMEAEAKKRKEDEEKKRLEMKAKEEAKNRSKRKRSNVRSRKLSRLSKRLKKAPNVVDKRAVARTRERNKEMEKLREILSTKADTAIATEVDDSREIIHRYFKELTTLYNIAASRMSFETLYPYTFNGEEEPVEIFHNENADTTNASTVQIEEEEEKVKEETDDELRREGSLTEKETLGNWFKRQLEIYGITEAGKMFEVVDSFGKVTEELSLAKFIASLQKIGVRIPKMKSKQLFFEMLGDNTKKGKKAIVSKALFAKTVFGEKYGDDVPEEEVKEEVEQVEQCSEVKEKEIESGDEEVDLEVKPLHAGSNKEAFDCKKFGGYGLSEFSKKKSLTVANAMKNANIEIGVLKKKGWLTLLKQVSIVKSSSDSNNRDKFLRKDDIEISENEAIEIFDSILKSRSESQKTFEAARSFSDALLRSEFLKAIVCIAIQVYKNLLAKEKTKNHEEKKMLSVATILGKVIDCLLHGNKKLKVIPPDVWRARFLYSNKLSGWINQRYQKFYAIFSAWCDDRHKELGGRASRLSYCRWSDLCVRAGLVPGYRSTALFRLTTGEVKAREMLSLGPTVVGQAGTAKRLEWYRVTKPIEGFMGCLLQPPPSNGMSIDFRLAMEYPRDIVEPRKSFHLGSITECFLMSKSFSVRQRMQRESGGAYPVHCLLSFTEFLEALVRLADVRWRAPLAMKANVEHANQTAHGGELASRLSLLLENHLWPATFGNPSPPVSESVESLTPREEKEVTCGTWLTFARFMGQRGVMNELRMRLRRVKFCATTMEDDNEKLKDEGIVSVLDEAGDDETRELLKGGFVNKRYFLENLIGDLTFLFWGSAEYPDEAAEDHLIASLWNEAVTTFTGIVAQKGNSVTRKRESNDFPTIVDDDDRDQTFVAARLLKFLHSKKVRRSTDWRGNWIKEEFYESFWKGRIEQVDSKRAMDTYRIFREGFDSDWAMIAVPNIFGSSFTKSEYDKKLPKLREIVKIYYDGFHEIFDFECSLHDVSGALPFEAFQTIVREIKIIDGVALGEDDLNAIFERANDETAQIECKSVEDAQLKHANMLVRSEFIAALLMVAKKRYTTLSEDGDGKVVTVTEAIQKFLANEWSKFKERIKKDAIEYGQPLDRGIFRKKILYTKSMSYFWCAPAIEDESDAVLMQLDKDDDTTQPRTRLVQFREVFDAYTWGERREHGRMTYEAWQRLIKAFNIAGAMHRGECGEWSDVSCRIAFNQSHYFQVNPLRDRLKATTLGFEDFLEALVRTCQILAFDDDLKPMVLKMNNFYKTFFIIGELCHPENLKKVKKKSSKLAKRRRKEKEKKEEKVMNENI